MKKLPSALVILEEPFYLIKNQYFCELNWWRFGCKLAEHFEKFGLYVPLKEKQAPPNAVIVNPENMNVHARFYFKRTEECFKLLLTQKKRLLDQARQLFEQYEIIILRTPSPLAKLLASLAWDMSKPTILFVASNVLTQTSYATQSGLKAQVAMLGAKWLRSAELAIGKKSSFIAAWGEELLPIFRSVNTNTAIAAAPSLCKNEIYRREDTCNNQTIRIVRVARLLPSKGLEYLMEAVKNLRNNGRSIMLDIAGGEDEAQYKHFLHNLAEKLEISDYVTFHGQIEFGEKLFKLYKNSDIHVISSLGEGLPRCVVEGRAFGLPTIATKTGGIPTVITDEIDGLLIEPASAQQITVAVEKLISNPALRKNIIKQGYEMVRHETVEYQSARLAGMIDRALHGAPLGAAADDIHQS